MDLIMAKKRKNAGDGGGMGPAGAKAGGGEPPQLAVKLMRFGENNYVTNFLRLAMAA